MEREKGGEGLKTTFQKEKGTEAGRIEGGGGRRPRIGPTLTRKRNQARRNKNWTDTWAEYLPSVLITPDAERGGTP